MSFDDLKNARMRRAIRIMTSNQILERIGQVNRYLSSISPKVSRYQELRAEWRLLRERYDELTNPPLI